MKPLLINRPVKRVFTFGCSFTGYAWMTWAEIVAHDLDIPLYNYGKSGAGNPYMFNMLIQADSYYKFNQDDLIIISWTNVWREDRYIQNRWMTPGNIYHLGFYDKTFIEKYADVTGYLIRDLALIKATDNILFSIGCQYHFLSMNNFVENHDQFSNNSINETFTITQLKNLYERVIKKINPSFYQVLWNNDINYKIKQELEMFGTYFADRHPTPLEHLEYLQKVFDHKFKDQTINDVNAVYQRWHHLCKTLSQNKKFLVYYLEKPILNDFIKQSTLKNSEPLFQI